MNNNKKKPYYEIIADKLIEQLENGTSPFQKRWKSGERQMPFNPVSGTQYKGVNSVRLALEQRADPRWMTYKQASEIGAQVRKGEKGVPIQYWKFTEERDKLDKKGKPVLDKNGKPEKETVRLSQPRVFWSHVFNGEQIDNLPEYQPEPDTPEKQFKRHERAEKILATTDVAINHVKGDRAFYQMSRDSITLPTKEQFNSADAYYATALHELGHATGHPSRLNRSVGKNPFGSEEYAKEELRAEISSLMVGDEIGLGFDPGQHTAYIGSWLKVLKDDPREIIYAARDADHIKQVVMGLEESLEVSNQVANKYRNPDIDKEQAQEQKQHSEIKIEHINSEREAGRNYINVPYEEKNEAKQLGARWDAMAKSWFIPEGKDENLFAKWKDDKEQQQTKATNEPENGQDKDKIDIVRQINDNTIYTTISSVNTLESAEMIESKIEAVMNIADDKHTAKQFGLSERERQDFKRKVAVAERYISDKVDILENREKAMTQDEFENKLLEKPHLVSTLFFKGLTDQQLDIVSHHLDKLKEKFEWMEDKDASKLVDARIPMVQKEREFRQLVKDKDFETMLVNAHNQSNEGYSALESWRNIEKWAKENNLQARIDLDKLDSEFSINYYQDNIKLPMKTLLSLGDGKAKSFFKEGENFEALPYKSYTSDQQWQRDALSETFAVAIEKEAARIQANKENTEMDKPQAAEKTFINVPFEEKDTAKQFGAKWDRNAKSWFIPEGVDKALFAQWMHTHESTISTTLSPQEQFANALKQAGLEVNGTPEMDGKLHRVKAEGDKGAERSGAYIGFLDGHPAGMIQNFRTGIKENWKAEGMQKDPISPERKAQLAKEAEEHKRARAEERQRGYIEKSQKVEAEIKHMQEAKSEHPYLALKNVEPHGAKQDDNGRLVIPAMDVEGRVWTLQKINMKQDGGSFKAFEKGGKKTGNFNPVGGLDSFKKSNTIVIAEGFATGATLHETTGLPVAVAFDANNLSAVAKSIKEKWPEKDIIIAADNDKFREQKDGVNTGLVKANSAAKAVNGTVLYPEFDKADKSLSDYNDLVRENPEAKKQIKADFLSLARVKQTQRIEAAKDDKAKQQTEAKEKKAKSKGIER